MPTHLESLTADFYGDWRNPTFGQNSQNEEISHIRPSPER
jgi:hypothetical protein